MIASRLADARLAVKNFKVSHARLMKKPPVNMFVSEALETVHSKLEDRFRQLPGEVWRLAHKLARQQSEIELECKVNALVWVREVQINIHQEELQSAYSLVDSMRKAFDSSACLTMATMESPDGRGEAMMKVENEILKAENAVLKTQCKNLTITNRTQADRLKKATEDILHAVHHVPIRADQLTWEEAQTLHLQMEKISKYTGLLTNYHNKLVDYVLNIRVHTVAANLNSPPLPPQIPKLLRHGGKPPCAEKEAMPGCGCPATLHRRFDFTSLPRIPAPQPKLKTGTLPI